jgi:hypothetical protein
LEFIFQIGRSLGLKSNSKVRELLVAFFMTLALDTTMSFVMVTINTGWNEGFIYRFLNNWLIGFFVAFPTSILAIPIAKKLANKLVK